MVVNLVEVVNLTKFRQVHWLEGPYTADESDEFGQNVHDEMCMHTRWQNYSKLIGTTWLKGLQKVDEFGRNDEWKYISFLFSMVTWQPFTTHFWRRQSPSQCYCSKEKIPELWKDLYVNCCDFFYAQDFVGRIGIMFLNFTPLRSPDIFIAMP